MGDRNRAAESGLQYGFKAGWAAACHVIAEELRKVGGGSVADTVEGWAEHAPEIDLVRMQPGESIEDANERLEREKKGDRS